MSQYFTSQILVLAMLVPVVIRFLFNRSARIDTIVILAPFSLLVSVLNLFVYGLSVTNLIILAVTLFVCIINFRAVLRLISGLVVDFYHGPFIFGSIIGLFCIVSTLVLLLVFCPMADTRLSVKGKSSDAYTVTRQVYVGSAYSGMQLKTDYFSSPSAVLYTVSPKADQRERGVGLLEPVPGSKSVKNTVLLYIPDVCTRTDDFLPAMKVLAEQGYTVLGADFAVKDISYTENWRDSLWSLDFYMRLERIRKPDVFAEARNRYNQKKAQEAALLIEMAESQYPGARFVLVGDKIHEPVLKQELPDIEQIYIDLNGCALQCLTNPLEAWLIDRNRWSRRQLKDFNGLPLQLAWYIINSLR